jgi:hypothetical protein
MSNLLGLIAMFAIPACGYFVIDQIEEPSTATKVVVGGLTVVAFVAAMNVIFGASS